MEGTPETRPERVDSVGFAWESLRSRPLNRLRIRSATQLFEAGADLIDATGLDPLGGGRLLLVAQATRGHHTFEAVIAASRIGRGVQGAMLNRSLYDDVLDIHWTAANLESAPELADQHDRLIALAEHDLEVRHGQPDRELTDEERAELEALIETYGGRGRAFLTRWHKATPEECLRLVQGRWQEEPDAARLLNYLFDPIQKRNNLMLHGSPTSYRQTFSQGPEGGRLLNRVGPDPRWTESLAQGAGAYYLVMRLVAAEFDYDRSALEQAFAQATGCCRKLEDLPDLSSMSATTPCPCRSGLMVGSCHGLPREDPAT